MFIKALILSLLLLLPFGASANCDLSVKNVKAISKSYLDVIGSKKAGKPKLIVSNKKVKGYYAEELKGVITIYPKSFKRQYCDQYFDSLTPFINKVIAHEYTHFLDEKNSLSKKIGEKEMSEKTAEIGEHVFDMIAQASKTPPKKLSKADKKKFNKLLSFINRR